MFNPARAEEYLPSLKMEDIPARWQWFVQAYGLEAMIQLCRMRGGSNLYIPKLAGICLRTKYRVICEEHADENLKKLARKYRITERRIQQIVAEEKQRTGTV